MAGLSGNWLVMGRVLRPHGLGGLLRVRSYAQRGTLFEASGAVLLRPPARRPHVYRVVSARPHKDIVFLMKLEGVNSVEDAEALRGAEVLVPAEAIPREQGEYLWQELIGLDVFLETGGESIGRISHIVAAGGHDIYVVGSGRKEIYIPATYEVIREIDLEKGRMTIAPIEGLLDLNES